MNILFYIALTSTRINLENIMHHKSIKVPKNIKIMRSFV